MNKDKVAELAEKLGDIAFKSGLDPLEQIRALALAQEFLTSFISMKYRVEKKSKEEVTEAFIEILKDAFGGDR